MSQLQDAGHIKKDCPTLEYLQNEEVAAGREGSGVVAVTCVEFGSALVVKLATDKRNLEVSLLQLRSSLLNIVSNERFLFSVWVLRNSDAEREIVFREKTNRTRIGSAEMSPRIRVIGARTH